MTMSRVGHVVLLAALFPLGVTDAGCDDDVCGVVIYSSEPSPSHIGEVANLTPGIEARLATFGGHAYYIDGKGAVMRAPLGSAGASGSAKPQFVVRGGSIRAHGGRLCAVGERIFCFDADGTPHDVANQYSFPDGDPPAIGPAFDFDESYAYWVHKRFLISGQVAPRWAIRRARVDGSGEAEELLEFDSEVRNVLVAGGRLVVETASPQKLITCPADDCARNQRQIQAPFAINGPSELAFDGRYVYTTLASDGRVHVARIDLDADGKSEKLPTCSGSIPTALAVHEGTVFFATKRETEGPHADVYEASFDGLLRRVFSGDTVVHEIAVSATDVVWLEGEYSVTAISR